MQLTAENVNNIFTECLSAGDPDTGANEIIGNGVIQDFQFNRQKLNSRRNDIESMIDQLPDVFKQSVGGGWSFLNIVDNKDGEQWTDLHQTAEQLLALGTAINKMGFNAPKTLWPSLPGGMPYVYIKD